MVHARRMTNQISIGVAAAIGPDLAAALAPLVEQAGFHALWVNDTPGDDALAVLEAAAATTTTLGLATGVVPVDRRPAAELAAQVNASALPQERLLLGIGSGAASVGALDLMTEAAATLRHELSARVVFGALGPKMRTRAVAHSDGVLLSWLTPAVAAAQALEAHAIDSSAHVALYVRTALDPAARERLRDESRRYAGYGSYAANFARLAMSVEQTVLDAADEDAPTRLTAYRAGVDEVVLRAITPADTLDDYQRFLDGARELMR